MRIMIGCIFGQASETDARTGHWEIFDRPAGKVLFPPQFNQISVDLGCLEGEAERLISIVRILR